MKNILKFFLRGFLAVGFGLLWIFRNLLGDLRWSAPTWLRSLGRYGAHFCRFAKQKPHLAFMLLMVLSGMVAASYKGYLWWQARPQPYRVHVEVVAPLRTEIEAKAKSERAPKPVTITFGDSVAPLAAVGTQVSDGVRLEPRLDGAWRWMDDKTLAFFPTEDWPVGVLYRAFFEATLFKPDILLDQNRVKFSSPKFVGQINAAEFYQDPLKKDLKKAIVEMGFSHPVHPAELEKRIHFKLKEKNQERDIHFSVTYDPLHLKAFIHSESLSIPKEEAVLFFELEEGGTALKGGGFLDGFKRTIFVPGLHSLKIAEVTAQVVANDKEEVDQVLVFDATHTLDQKDLSQALSVWVLPKFHPDKKQEDIEDSESYAWNVNEVTDAVLQKSKKLELKPIPTEQQAALMQSYKYQADVGDRLFVQIKRGLKSFGGYELGNDVFQVVTTPPFPAKLKILGNGALLTLSGEKKFGFLARDVSGVKVEIGRVLPSQLQHLVSQSFGSYQAPRFLDYYRSFNADHITERFEKKIELPALKPGQNHYESFDLKEYLNVSGSEERRGVFLINVKSYDTAAEEKRERCLEKNKRQLGEAPTDSENACGDLSGEWGGYVENSEEAPSDSRMILVTDLGILVKKSQDRSYDVFVQSIYSGEPVSGAKVEIVGLNGIALFSELTDSQGRAHFTDFFNGFSKERDPTLIVVTKENDLSFMPLHSSVTSLDLSRFDIGGIEGPRVLDQVSAYLFSDRGVYRPGDTFHIGMIVKPARWETDVSGIPLRVEVLDARGLVIRREKIKVPPGGFIEFSHTLDESSPTGSYDVSLFLVKEDDQISRIGSTQIKVQEFLPDRLKVTAKLSSDENAGWVHPKDLKALVLAENLFGTPAENRDVSVELSLSPAYTAFETYSDYAFYDPKRAKESFEEVLADRKTDQNGHAAFDLHLEKYAEATYRLDVLTRVFDAGAGRSVAARVSALVSDLPYLVGFKADGDLNFVSRGSERRVSLIAVDPKLEKKSVQSLKLQRIEVQYVSVLNKQQNGTYAYESQRKEVLLQEVPLEIPASGFDLLLDTTEPGSFAYIVRDAKDTELNRISYVVVGEGNLTRNLERNAELELALNKSEYQPDEEIEVSIRAPYVGAGLITIERDKVYAVQWFKADTLASVQKIRVPKDFEGNGYVMVQFVRDPSSDEIFMSPLSYGVVPFETSLGLRRNSLNIAIPDQVKPGETLKIQVASEQPTRVVVFAVDEGILQVARYRLPEPLEFFFQKRRLEVYTSEILSMILPEFNKLLFTSGAGGDAEGAFGKYLNPFKRKRDKPVAYWSGIVELEGQKEFHYPVPDSFNGALRVMAVSVGEAKIGTAQASTLVRGDFVISPNLPLAVTPGDEFELSVGVSNNAEGSGKEAPISLLLETSDSLKIVGDQTQILKIDEGREGVAIYRVKVADPEHAQLGSTNLTFKVAFHDKTAQVSTDVSVRPATPRYTELSLGSFETEANLALKRHLYAEYRDVKAGVSFVPWIFASGLSRYLADFEHLCTEQIVSQAITALVLKTRPEFGKEALPSARTLSETFNILRARQNAQGGFGLWTASVQPDDFVSVYALHLMIEAETRGEMIPDGLLENGLDYLKTFASSPGKDLWDLRQRAYAAYLLTRKEIVSTPLLTAIRESLESRYALEWKKDLAGLYIAASYQLLKQEKEAKALIEEGFSDWTNQASRKSFEYSRYYDPLIHDAQVFYVFARHFPEHFDALSKEGLKNILQPLADGRFNTLSAAYLVLALEAYANRIETKTEGSLRILGKDAQGLEKTLELPDNLVPWVAIAPGTVGLHFEGSRDFPAYYAISESGFDKNPPKEELRKGIEILRDYLDANGKPATEFRVGDEITVRLRFRTVDRKAVSDAALIDLLPGGFEPVLQLKSNNQGPVLASASGLTGFTASPKIRHAEPREDRVIFYGEVTQDLGELTYQIKATNVGRFVVPSAYAESMYERGVQARSAGGQVLTVKGR